MSGRPGIPQFTGLYCNDEPHNFTIEASRPHPLLQIQFLLHKVFHAERGPTKPWTLKVGVFQRGLQAPEQLEASQMDTDLCL